MLATLGILNVGFCRFKRNVLVEDKVKFKRKYEFKIIDKPTLDDIMLIYIKGDKQDENYKWFNYKRFTRVKKL